MKKILSICLLAVLGVTGLATKQLVLAEDETVLSEHVKRIGEATVETLDGGVTYTNQTLATYYQPIGGQTYYTDRGVYSYEIPAGTDETKVVSWSLPTTSGYKPGTLVDIAKNYEETHPGWKVLGGTSAAGFNNMSDRGATYETISAYVQEGNVFKKDVSSESFKSHVAFNYDGSHVVVRVPDVSEYLQLKVYDDNENIITNHEVKFTNAMPTTNEIALLIPGLNQTLDLTNYFVYKGEYTTFKQTKYNLDVNPNFYLTGTNNGIYLEGMLEQVSETSVSEVSDHSFYIVSTKDLNINNQTKIKCQFDLLGEYANIESMVEYMFRLVDNNEVVDLNYIGEDGSSYKSHSGYYTSDRQRCAIGFKSDGSTVMLVAKTINMVTAKGGPTQLELGEIMKNLGCVDAYQFDGGGTVTFIKRNDTGGFDLINNPPQDGNMRSITDGLLVVVKDHGIQADDTLTTRNMIMLNTKSTPYSDEVTNLKAYVTGIFAGKTEVETKEFTSANSELEITGVNEDTEYDIKVEYQASSVFTNEIVSNTRYLKAKSKAFEMPYSNLGVTNISKESFEVVKKESETSSWITNVVVKVGDSEYLMGDQDYILIEGLFADTEYEITFDYDVIDPETKQIYHGQDSPRKIRTLSFYLPTISEFMVSRKYDNRIIFQYAITDTDNVVTRSELLVNNTPEAINGKTGTVTIRDLDFTTTDYTFQIVIYYQSEFGFAISVKSETISFQTSIKTYDIIYNLDGGINPSDAPNTYNEGSVITLPTPTKDGYTFLGWYVDDIKVEKIVDTDTGDVTITAKWQKNETPTPPVTPTPTEHKKKGCKKSMEYLMTFTTLLGLACFFLRKKK